MILNRLFQIDHNVPVFFLAFIVSIFLTGRAYRLAIKKKVLDIPNDRSSHSIPTPRGGGLGLVLTLIPGLLILKYLGEISGAMLFALLGGGGLVAFIGWADDLKPIPARWRILVHAISAGWAVYWIGGVSTLSFGQYIIPLGFLGTFLTFLAILWMINLYNFMDGVDGLAGGEALTVGLAGGLLFLLEGVGNMSSLPLLLAGCSAGFLVWNWPPAKIFMGDIGSGFIGYCLAVIWLQGTVTFHSEVFWVWMILLSIFISDATYTLISRIIRREQWYEAHRTHAYQRLIQMGWSHLQVTGFVMLVNLLILFPAAWYTMENQSHAFWVTAILFSSLFFVWRLIQKRYAIYQMKNMCDS